MSADIALRVVGLPASQGSKTRMPNGAMLDGTSPKARANLAAWRSAVRAECQRWLEAHPQEPLAEPVSVSIDLRFPTVVSAPFRHYHACSPDLDKVVRSVLDALVQGAVLADDRFVALLIAKATYCGAGESAGAMILIRSLAESERDHHARRKAAAVERRKKAREAT